MSQKNSYEFKLKVVEEYLNGTLGYTLLAKKYHISATSLIEKWVNQFKIHEKAGIKLVCEEKSFTRAAIRNIIKFIPWH